MISGSQRHDVVSRNFKSDKCFRYLENIVGLSNSILRFLLNSTNSDSFSMPRNRRPDKFAAIPVVELPANGSNIQSFVSVFARIMRVNRGTGFCVGCLPHDFSHLLIDGNLRDISHLFTGINVFHQLVIIFMRNF